MENAKNHHIRSLVTVQILGTKETDVKVCAAQVKAFFHPFNCTPTKRINQIYYSQTQIIVLELPVHPTRIVSIIQQMIHIFVSAKMEWQIRKTLELQTAQVRLIGLKC